MTIEVIELFCISDVFYESIFIRLSCKIPKYASFKMLNFIFFNVLYNIKKSNNNSLTIFLGGQ